MFSICSYKSMLPCWGMNGNPESPQHVARDFCHQGCAPCHVTRFPGRAGAQGHGPRRSDRIARPMFSRSEDTIIRQGDERVDLDAASCASSLMACHHARDPRQDVRSRLRRTDAAHVGWNFSEISHWQRLPRADRARGLPVAVAALLFVLPGSEYCVPDGQGASAV